MHGHASAFGDVNGDGIADLFVGTFADRPPERYALRGAKGPKPDQLLVSGPDLEAVDGWSAQLQRTSGSLFADLDADGDDDLVLIRHAGVGGDREADSLVYENVDGSLHARAVLTPPGFRGRTPTVADFDRDGLLDLYISEDRYGEVGGLLLANLGSFEFEDRTIGSGLEGDFSLGATAADFNGDGLSDIATSNHIFVNRGGMSFVDSTPAGFVAEPCGDEDDPAGVAVGDLNNDGSLDLVLGHHYRSTIEHGVEYPIRVFINRSNSSDVRFEEVTSQSGLPGLVTLAPHVAVADVNNDSIPDIVSSASAGSGDRPAIFLGRGGEIPAFESPPGLGAIQYWVGAPVVDIDRDGNLDVFALEWEPGLPSRMFASTGVVGHWLEVSFAGPSRGVGAWVRVFESSGELVGATQIGVSMGYSSGHMPVAHFGLGPRTDVDIEIELDDGELHRLEGVPVDSHIRWPGGCSAG